MGLDGRRTYYCSEREWQQLAGNLHSFWRLQNAVEVLPTKRWVRDPYLWAYGVSIVLYVLRYLAALEVEDAVCR